MTSPIVRCAAQQIDGAEIHFLVKDKFAAAIEHNPHIAAVHRYSGDLRSSIAELRAERFDHIVDLQNNLRSLRVRMSLHAPSTVVNKLNIRKWLLVNLKIDLMPRRHIVDRYFDTVSRLGVANDQRGIDFYGEPGSEAILGKTPAGLGGGYVAVAMGAAHNTKQIPTEQLVAMLNLAGKPVALLGGKGDIDRAGEVEVNLSVPVWNLCGQSTLGETAQVARHARALLTPDTGVMHIASAFDTPIMSVWGNTVPKLGMYPYRPGRPESFAMAEVGGLRCRPCSKIGFEQCPKGNFRCMEEHDINKIAADIRRMWDNATNDR